MRTRMLVSILIIVLAVLIIADSCATRLMQSAKRGDYAKVKRLIEEGADVNAVSAWGGNTALMSASENGHPEIAKLLIEEGADVKAQN